MFRKTGTLLTAVLLGLTATVATTGPAVAAPADRDGRTLSVGKLILSPTERGYRGSVSLTVTNTGSEGDYFYYKLREPVPGAFQYDGTACDMFDMRVEDNRRVANCSLTDNWADLAPGESTRNVLDFHVLTTPRTYPMIMNEGWVEVYSSIDGLVARTPLSALFRSTNGSLTRPRPYVQDAQPDASIRLDGPVTVLPDGEGNLRVPVTIRYDGDAPHASFSVARASSLPAGSVFWQHRPVERSAERQRRAGAGAGAAVDARRGVQLRACRQPADRSGRRQRTDRHRGGDQLVPDHSLDADPSDNVVQTTLAVAANG